MLRSNKKKENEKVTLRFQIGFQLLVRVRLHALVHARFLLERFEVDAGAVVVAVVVAAVVVVAAAALAVLLTDDVASCSTAHGNPAKSATSEEVN